MHNPKIRSYEDYNGAYLDTMLKELITNRLSRWQSKQALLIKKKTLLHYFHIHSFLSYFLGFDLYHMALINLCDNRFLNPFFFSFLNCTSATLSFLSEPKPPKLCLLLLQVLLLFHHSKQSRIGIWRFFEIQEKWFFSWRWWNQDNWKE